MTEPQDHLTKQRNGEITVHGLELSINREQLDDWEVVECIAEVQDDATSEARKLAVTVKLLKLLLGDSYTLVKDTLRSENDGQLSSATMSEFVTELFGALNPNS